MSENLVCFLQRNSDARECIRTRRRWKSINSPFVVKIHGQDGACCKTIRRVISSFCKAAAIAMLADWDCEEVVVLQDLRVRIDCVLQSLEKLRVQHLLLRSDVFRAAKAILTLLQRVDWSNTDRAPKNIVLFGGHNTAGSNFIDRAEIIVIEIVFRERRSMSNLLFGKTEIVDFSVLVFVGDDNSTSSLSSSSISTCFLANEQALSSYAQL
jgi:hypothetical protein